MPDCSTNSLVLSLGWMRDTRDNGLAPNKGTLQRANFDYATPIGEVEYARLTYEIQWFLPVTKTITYATNLETGYGFHLEELSIQFSRIFMQGYWFS